MSEMQKRAEAENAALAKMAMSWLENVVTEREEEKAREEKMVWGSHRMFRMTSKLLLGFQIFLIIIIATCARKGSEVLDVSVYSNTGTQGYNMFIGVELMMFIGFGYLMTFMRWYGLGAVGFTMLITAVAFQWAVLTEAFFAEWYDVGTREAWPWVEFNIYTLQGAMYAISAVLISFGALIGKISPLQLTVMAIIELAGHSLNYKVFMGGIMKLADVGGTYLDHMYGAYFGLAVSWMLGKPSKEPINPAFGAVADIFSIIGTLLLWVYWPSFVAGAMDDGSVQQQRAIVNTILALCGSTIAAFVLSVAISEHIRLRPVDIQNATLAGGVAIGCVANLQITPFSAVMLGIATGLASTFGFNKVLVILEEKFNIHDTCGVHNLHGIPSVIGALASVIVAAYSNTGDRELNRAVYGNWYGRQWWLQLVSIFFVMAFAISLGLVTGKILLWLKGDDEIPNYVDNAYWETADDFGHTLESELAAMFTRSSSISARTKKLVDALVNVSHHGRRPKSNVTSTAPASELPRTAAGMSAEDAILAKKNENDMTIGDNAGCDDVEEAALPVRKGGYRPALQTMLSVSHKDFVADDDDDVDFFEVEGDSQLKNKPVITPAAPVPRIPWSSSVPTAEHADSPNKKKSFREDEGMPDPSSGFTKSKPFVPSLDGPAPRPVSFRINSGAGGGRVTSVGRAGGDLASKSHDIEETFDEAVNNVHGAGLAGVKMAQFCQLIEDASPLIRDFFRPHVTHVSIGRLVLSLPYREELAGGFGATALPDGMVAALADHTGRFCAWSALSDPKMRVDAVDMKIDYQHPAPLEELVFEAELSKVMEMLIGVEVIVWNGKKTTKLAVARGLYKGRMSDTDISSALRK